MTRFSFNGRRLEGQPEDTIATALLRNQIRVFDRSIKRRRPRGVSCFAGHCMSCVLEVDGEADVVTCQTKLRPGAEVRSQVAMPSPKLDVRAPLQEAAFKFFGPELYYRLFTRPAWLSELWMRFLARMAGRARLAAPSAHPVPLPFTDHEVDILVVGGGAAGLAAAQEAAREPSLSVMLVERGQELGGAWRQWQAVGGIPEPFEPPTEPLPELPEAVQVLAGTTLLALYEDRTALAVSANSAHRIQYGRVIVAAGCYPRVVAFPNSDGPLFVPAAGLVRVLSETGWTPDSAVLLDVDGKGSAWQEVLEAAGVIVDRHSVTLDECLSGQLQGAQSRGMATVRLPTGIRVQADAVCWSAGWYPRTELIRAAGGIAQYDRTRDCFLPVLEDLAEAAPQTYAAGGAAGVLGFKSALTHGRLVGAAAAAQSGGAEAIARFELLAEQYDAPFPAQPSTGD